MPWHPQGLGGDVMWHRHPECSSSPVVLRFAAQSFPSCSVMVGGWLLPPSAFVPACPVCPPLLWPLEWIGVPGMAALGLAVMPSGAATPAPWFLGQCSCEALPSHDKPWVCCCKDTGGSGNTEGWAEPPSHQGTAAKGGFWNPLLCHRRAAAASQIPSSVDLPKGRGTAHSLLLHGCQQVHSRGGEGLNVIPAHSTFGLLQTLNQLRQTAPAPVEQHKAAVVLPCPGSKCASGMAHTCPTHAFMLCSLIEIPRASLSPQSQFEKQLQFLPLTWDMDRDAHSHAGGCWDHRCGTHPKH